MAISTAILNASQGVLHVIAPEQPPAIERADPVGAARDVFQGPEFWWKRIEQVSKPETSWLQSIVNAILSALSRIWNAVWEPIAKVLRLLFGRLAGESSGGTMLVWFLALAVLAWVVWKLIPLILEWFGRDARPVGLEAVASQALPAAADLRNQAEQAYRDGRHAEAIRLALLALIAALEKRGLLRYDSTRTNREYRAELRVQPELSARFGQLARIYEGVWYGREPAGPEQAAESIRLCESPIDGEALGYG